MLDPEAMKTFLALRRFEALLSWAVDTHLARHGLSFGRFMVLVNLIRAEGHSMMPAHLSDSCGVTRATITGLLSSLEKNGHVARESDPDDGRSSMVRLTMTGRRLLERLLPDHFARLTEVMSTLDADEKTELQRLLLKVSEKLRALTDP